MQRIVLGGDGQAQVCGTCIGSSGQRVLSGAVGRKPLEGLALHLKAHANPISEFVDPPIRAEGDLGCFGLDDRNFDHGRVQFGL